MSFTALVDVDFWQKDIVTDDSRIFFQCLVRYDGDYAVTPLYVPISMDTVMTPHYTRSMVNLYKQQRRWAWGVEHFPYLVKHFLVRTKFPVSKKLFYLWHQIEGMYTWATTPILLFILGKLPFWFAPEAAAKTVLAQNSPFIIEFILGLAMAGLIISAIFSVMLLPPRPKKYHPARFLFMILQWILLPFTLVIFGSIPAIDSQTRLMLGKYLGFGVTEKGR